MRGTRHNSRGAKHSGSGYVVKHNDREFDMEKSDNIDVSKSVENLYWNYYNRKFYHKNNQDKMTFENAEKKYYEEHFKQQWQEQNERYEKRRQQCYMKDFDNWRKSKRYCPEEQVLQLGNIDDHVDATQMKSVMVDYLKALQKFSRDHNNFLEILDVAYHVDEAVPHAHIRYVYQSKDANGNLQIGQNKALESAGIALPDATKAEGRYNNRKMTFDKIMRNMFLNICETHGIDIERDPEENVQHNRSKKKLVHDKMLVNKAIEQENARLWATHDDLKAQNEQLKQQIRENYKRIQACTNLSDKDIEIMINHILEDKRIREKRRIEQAEQIVPNQKHRKKDGKVSPADQQFS